ncbi:uncharacterized protein KGF55_001288 [Candida pseudojiufengensis]|uniref:uncharacterized protein n=1 Tax=Candida pseudojiufengensis TaxID=497109 RepID=UPI002224D41A|nr:uncharacterized protein KGF55_001288 [Candida pseudojiufengensis]KAI5965924.1 hypothetical protein KGF55_001288 [Candida pseudojiufengensis]
MTEVHSPIVLKSEQVKHLQPPLNKQSSSIQKQQQLPQQSQKPQSPSNLHPIQPSPCVVKTSREWVLPPRPKPGRKLKDLKDNKPKRKSCKKSKDLPQQSSNQEAKVISHHQSITPSTPITTSTTTKSIPKELSKDLNSDLSTISSLLQNVSIIDSENNYLKSNLLCLIHEYKHLKNLVTNPTTANTTPEPVDSDFGCASSPSIQDSTHHLTKMMNATSINTSIDSKVHKRLFKEVIEDEVKIDTNQNFENSINSPINYDSSSLSTSVSTPSTTNILSEFEKFINIEESTEPLKKCKTNDSIKLNTATNTSNSKSSLKSKKFAHYKDFHKLDTEEDSDLDINFEEDDEEYEDNYAEDQDHPVYSPSSIISTSSSSTRSSTSSSSNPSNSQNYLSTTTTNEELLSRTTSPYNSDFETNSLMSTLTRSTTVSSINTVIHEKPQLNIHSQPFSLKKLNTNNNFFELPKLKEENNYNFKFDEFMIDFNINDDKQKNEFNKKENEQKKIDDEYNMITDILEEKLMNNEINYYVSGSNENDMMNIDW